MLPYGPNRRVLGHEAQRNKTGDILPDRLENREAVVHLPRQDKVTNQDSPFRHSVLDIERVAELFGPEVAHVVEAGHRQAHEAAAARGLMAAAGRHSDALVLVLCGPGNNGGDGLEAAMHLHQWGKTVVVTWLGAQNEARVPADALASLVRARAAGVPFANVPPAGFDFAIDALLGIGAAPRPAAATNPTDLLGQWLALLRSSPQPVLAVDIPSGLNADTGASLAPESIATCDLPTRVGARFTLSLLTLKPGLFTASGRHSRIGAGA